MQILPSDYAAYQLMRFFNPRESYCLAWLAGALLFALAAIAWRRRGRGMLRPQTFKSLLGGRKLWLHRSSLLDIKLYLMHGVLLLAAYGLFEASSEAWRTGTVTLLGASPHLATPRWLSGSLITVAQLLVLELAYWAMHFAFHRIPALWELHKVHHSAEVMTPLSEWRQHPIEFVAFGNVASFSTGVVYGAGQWLFGAQAAPFTLFTLNALLVLHFATFHHLRHSGMWIAATGWLGRVIHSPAHHQIHHSTDPRHFDRNLGYALSLWDWAFGTLHVPARIGRVRLGVPDEPPYRGLLDTLVRPLAASLRTFRRA